MYQAFQDRWIGGWTNLQSVAECSISQRGLTNEDYAKVCQIVELGFEHGKKIGIMGRDGKERYRTMTRYLYRAYYDKTPSNAAFVARNKRALSLAMTSLVERTNSQKVDDAGRELVTVMALSPAET